MKAQIFETNKDLSPFIKCYWELESPKEETPTINTIIPDGCMKLIFHYGDEYKHHSENNDITTLPKYFLIGQLTKPYKVEPLWVTGTFMVVFHPHGVFPFIKDFEAKKIENTAIPLEKLFWKNGRILWEKILRAKNNLERIEIIEVFLKAQLKETQWIDRIISSTIDSLITAGWHLSIDTITKNRRQLERKFSGKIGLSPKQLAKIIRLQHCLRDFGIEKNTSFTELAHENKYYDQAHFNKDFKEFTGLTPKEFYGDDLKMSLIFENKK